MTIGLLSSVHLPAPHIILFSRHGGDIIWEWAKAVE
jgi:hypothetical protein